MSNGIFTITSEGKSANYYTEEFGALREVLRLLWSVNSVKERIPTTKSNDALSLTLYSKKMIPFCPHQSGRLFQPLEPDQYDFLQAELQGGERDLTHYTLDYDGNHFAMTNWGGDALTTISGPLDGVIGAYRGAMRKKNGKQHYTNDKVLVAELDRIMTLSAEDAPTLSAPGQPEMQL